MTVKPTTCSATRYHRPQPVQIDMHHVWPKYDGGPTDGERVPLCGSCHEATHELLRAYDKANGKPGWLVRRKYPRGVQRLAALGWDRITRRSL